jgi:hypothetical protein
MTTPSKFVRFLSLTILITFVTLSAHAEEKNLESGTLRGEYY